MRVIIFCALAFVVGCSDGAAPEMAATGGAGGQATSTGGVGGNTVAVAATGGIAGGTGGAAGSPVRTDAGTDAASIDAQPDRPTPADPCVGIARGQTSGPDPCGGPGTSQDISCVNLQSDIRNCGACFHACANGVNLAGCQGGICQ